MTRPEKLGYRLHVWPWLRRPGSLLLRDWLAITVGRDIWSWRPLDRAELAHELAHVRQWRRYGVMYVVRYAATSWRAWRAGRSWYRDNAFEVEARDAADAVRSSAARRGQPRSRCTE